MLHLHLRLRLHLFLTPIVYFDYGCRLFRSAVNSSRRHQSSCLGELLRDQSHFAEASVAAAAAPSSSPAGFYNSQQRPSTTTPALFFITHIQIRYNEVVFHSSVSGAVNMGRPRPGGQDGWSPLPTGGCCCPIAVAYVYPPPSRTKPRRTDNDVLACTVNQPGADPSTLSFS